MPLKTPSNIEYLGPKPNFTRDSYDTYEAMQRALESGHINEGHLSYCKETGKTMKAIMTPSGLAWKDVIGDLEESLRDAISEASQEATEALEGLSGRVERIEREILDDQDSGIGTNTRLDQVYDWFDRETHKPVLGIEWTKGSQGGLRWGTTHTYTATFSWEWASRVQNLIGMTLRIPAGTETRSFEDVGKTGNTPGDSYSWSTQIQVPRSSSGRVSLVAEWYNPADKGTIENVVIPVNPEFSWGTSGYPTGWVQMDQDAVYPLKVTLTVTNPPETDAFEFQDSSGGILETKACHSDSPLSFSQILQMPITETSKYRWRYSDTENSLSGTYEFLPEPSFFLVSPESHATIASVITGGFQGYIGGTGKTEIPGFTYTAGSTGIYLSPRDIRGLSAQSKGAGSIAWTTISGFSEKGTVTYLGRTYYYLMNPNIGAGTFQFKFV